MTCSGTRICLIQRSTVINCTKVIGRVIVGITRQSSLIRTTDLPDSPRGRLQNQIFGISRPNTYDKIIGSRSRSRSHEQKKIYRVGQKPDYFLKFITPIYVDTQKRSIYQTVQFFIWSSLRLVCCMSLHLN